MNMMLMVLVRIANARVYHMVVDGMDQRMLVDAIAGFFVGFCENSVKILQKMKFKITPNKSLTWT